MSERTEHMFTADPYLVRYRGAPPREIVVGCEGGAGLAAPGGAHRIRVYSTHAVPLDHTREDLAAWGVLRDLGGEDPCMCARILRHAGWGVVRPGETIQRDVRKLRTYVDAMRKLRAGSAGSAEILTPPLLARLQARALAYACDGWISGLHSPGSHAIETLLGVDVGIARVTWSEWERVGRHRYPRDYTRWTITLPLAWPRTWLRGEARIGDVPVVRVVERDPSGAPVRIEGLRYGARRILEIRSATVRGGVVRWGR